MKQAQTRTAGIPDRLRSGDWEGYWRSLLADLGTNRAIFVDFDDTAWDDILMALNVAFSPVDPETGEQRWKQYHAAFRGKGAIINGVFRKLNVGEHAQVAYGDLLQHRSLSELVSFAQDKVRLIGGFKDFVRYLRRRGIAVVGISHGVWQPAQGLIDRHGLDIPFIANWVEDGAGVVLADETPAGVDKARLARLAIQLGYELVACAGDSFGDAGMAQVTSNAGGLVIARGDGGLAAWCKDNVPARQWVLVEAYDQPVAAHGIMLGAIIDRRLASR
jgi:phosphoglycolate phosphatase-like HAD superfamily hydrolase